MKARFWAPLGALFAPFRCQRVPKNIILNLRQAKELEEAELSLTKALEEKSEEIISEHLRQANRSLERIIGNIDIEDVLGNIFSKFCIGK